MAGPDPAHEYLQRLRGWRNRPEPDLSMGFLKALFKREVERPFKQLGALGELWQQLVPAALAAHTRLDSLTRGVLHVTVDSSVHLYELDRLLRGGLQHQLISQHKGPAFRRVQLRVAPMEAPSPERPAEDEGHLSRAKKGR